MTVNINALIDSLGKTYKEMLDAELIPYKTPPTGFSGDPDISLDMAKEGVYLSFKRDGRILKEIMLRIQNDKINNWEFPNILPFGLQKFMSMAWVHSTYGQPLRSVEPKVVMRRAVGRADLYSVKGYSPLLYMQIRYDMSYNVQKITFFPSSELRW